jgi:hypothetical protein
MVTRAPFWRSAALSLALAAMMLRGLMPVGWMPASQGSGSLVVLCTLSGPVHVYLGTDGQPHNPKPSHGDSGRVEACPFAGAPHFALLAGPPPALGTIVSVPRPGLLVRREAALGRSQFSLHAPRAPPSPA